MTPTEIRGAVERLVEALGSRGLSVVVGECCGRYAAAVGTLDTATRAMVDSIADGDTVATQADAVSAAALLALRGGA